MRDFFWRVGTWFADAGRSVGDALRRALPNDRDTPEVRGLKLTVFLFVGIVGLMVLIGLITFSLAVRGQEQTLVPNVTGKDLVTALVEMQEKELYPRVSLRLFPRIPCCRPRQSPAAIQRAIIRADAMRTGTS